ncbi:PRAME family member 15-like [Physeter macrocephalus]|uniref:PRAME family member 15-like n=1 Tax=Physeter macrocephalus TaxID=9755 RepID=A0A2Y9ELK4_PHYMC|nr:PRAME family member 15-like [Physeter catodon]|eukprot:XP_007104888.2 PRAME family member 9/15-like [Physeter catodon]
MSVWNPLRLLDLAAMDLLRDEASAISTLEYLPTELFPPLFMEAFYGRHSEALKAMVQAWPFVRLPLGGLMQMPHRGTLQAVLDGIDVLVAQQDRPRRCKLQVLDLRNTGKYFWRMWSGSNSHVHSSSMMAPVAEDSSRTKQPLALLEVFVELRLKESNLDEFLIYLIRWVEQRKGSIHLCCKKLKIITMPTENITEVLSRVQLDCIQEVQVNNTWHVSTLATFAPLLGQMSNVQRLLLSHVYLSAFDEQQQHVFQFTSQFLRLHHLRDLYMESPSFLEGCLDQMLSCLKTTLDNLSITNCLLTESDLTHLSQCPNIRQLKGLDLSGVTLTNFSPELLQVLLEKVAATLQELDLELCGIMDSQLEAILPALSHCSQLRTFSICGNLLSMAIMEKLLQHTAGLLSLSQELYPAPRESYSPQGDFQPERLVQLRAGLLKILRDLGHPRTIWISSSPCPHCGENTFYHPEPVVYSYNTPA